MRLFLLFIPVLSFAQPDSVSLPMKGRIVFYESVFVSQKGSVKDNADKSAKWMAETFKEIKEPRPAVKVADGKVEGTGIVKIVINEAGDFYWMKFSIAIQATDSTCIFQVFDFYEKPTFRGVTNDYSKIEYRWRDFKKGKPWTPSDRKLFVGMDEAVRGLSSAYAEWVVSGKR